MGQLCGRIVEEADMKEVSVVEEPADKRCRALSISDGEMMRDVMTWREAQSDVFQE
jgi:hypothetical protein